MKTRYAIFVFVLSLTAAEGYYSSAQEIEKAAAREFMKQTSRDNAHVFIAQNVAESLLQRKVAPIPPRAPMMLRVSGTVIVVCEIGKDGRVRRAMAISGPKVLRPPALAAVKQWLFKPYVLNGAAIAVTTSIKLPVSNF